MGENRMRKQHQVLTEQYVCDVQGAACLRCTLSSMSAIMSAMYTD